MKGKTIIELTDVNTGEVERHVDDNMITNALQYYFANFGQLNPSALESYTDYITPMLGGLLLLDSRLAESADHVLLEGGIKMTGAAIKNVLNSGNPTERGSWNETESGWVDNVYTQVFDFTTSQANGTIACACLTSDVYAYIGAGNSTSMVAGTTSNTYSPINYRGNALTKTFSTTPYMLINTKGNSIKYCTMAGANLSDGLIVIKEYLAVTELNLRSHRTTPLKITEDVTVAFPFEVPSGYIAQSIGNDGDTLYFAIGRGGNALGNWNFTFSNTVPIYVCTINDNDEITLILTITPETFGLSGTKYMRYDHGRDIMRYNNGNIIISISSTNDYAIPDAFYKINIESSSVTELDNIESITGVEYNYVWHETTNAIYTSYFKIDLIDDAIYPISHNSANLATKAFGVGNPLGGFYSNTIWRNPMYLATINNLEEPVIKDVSKTMKVIYQLTF